MFTKRSFLKLVRSPCSDFLEVGESPLGMALGLPRKQEGSYKSESDDTCHCILYPAFISFRSITFGKMSSKYWILICLIIVGLCEIEESQASPALASILVPLRHHNGKNIYHITVFENRLKSRIQHYERKFPKCFNLASY